MSKTDRKKKLAAKKRAIAESVRKGVILASTPKRKKCGRKAEPKGGWGQAGPTPEVLARRQALLPNGRGCVDDWIDVAEGTGLLAPRLAEALRRYRGLLIAFAKMAGAPALTFMMSSPSRSEPTEEEEIEYRRIKHAIEDIELALRQAHRKDADTLEACIASMGMPTSAQMDRIRKAAELVAQALGI